MTTLSEDLAGWASALRLDAIPARVIAMARTQVASALAAARATIGHPLGERITRTFGSPLQDDPKGAACALAALTIALELDETLFAGHSTHSTVGVALAYSRQLELGGGDFTTAVIAGNECATRITAAATLGRFRGQTATHTHLGGAVTSRLHAEGAPAERWVSALGLAFASPPWPLGPAFTGSDAKVLGAATPIRTALDACDGAAAGLRGRSDLLEHADGFLATFSEVPLPEMIRSGLGTRWHTETLSPKIHPGSAYLDSALDCALELHHQLNGSAIEEVVVHGSLFTVGLEYEASRYLAGPDSPPTTLAYSVSYSVASALLTGSHTVRDLAPPVSHDPALWELASRVRVEHDLRLTRQAVLATAPLGAAIRMGGAPAIDWLAAAAPEARQLELGEPEGSFESATKEIGARVEVRLSDGRTLTAARDVAEGAIGDSTRATHADLARAKLAACDVHPEVADRIERLETLTPAELRETFQLALG